MYIAQEQYKNIPYDAFKEIKNILQICIGWESVSERNNTDRK